MSGKIDYIDRPVDGRHVAVRFLTDQRNEAGGRIIMEVTGLTVVEVEKRVYKAHPSWVSWGATIGIPDRREGTG